MALTDEEREEVARVVRDELRSLELRIAVVPGDEDDAAPAPPATSTAASTRSVGAAAAPPAGRIARRLGFAPHGLLAALALGALFCCSAFDVAAHAAPEPYTYPRSSYWLLVLALLTGLLAAATGVADHWRLDPEAASRRHQVVAYVAIGLSVVSFLLRRRTDFVDEVPVGIVALTLVALVLLLGSWVQGVRLPRPGAPATADHVHAATGEQAAGEPSA